MEVAQNTVGLTDAEVLTSRSKYGSNSLANKSEYRFFNMLLELVLEPLFLILIGVCVIYFIMGQTQEAFLMLGALGIVTSISIFQEHKSRNAVDALKKLNSPKAKVFRNAKLIEILTEDLVVGDVIQLVDGAIVPADASIVNANDFSANESILTGESIPLIKGTDEPLIFQGTMVVSGACTASVIAVGAATQLGKIQQSLQEIEPEKTPLQIQVHNFVKYMLYAGLVAFVLVFGVNYYLSGKVLHALMHGLTLAMSIIPEEIPVALSTFMALGAYRMYKNKVIVRTPSTVETLGAATVICVDKTGTLTENRMELSAIYDFESKKVFDFTKSEIIESPVLEYAVWSSEVEPFDAMEIAIHTAYTKVAKDDKRKQFVMFKEYPLGGTPPIMTHVFENEKKERISAVKGSVEGVLHQTKLSDTDKELVQAKAKELSSKGYRILAVGRVETETANLPETQFEFTFILIGLIAFYDPPRKNISSVLKQFYEAGIKVKMITGDHAETALAIANQVELQIGQKVLTGPEVMDMEMPQLEKQVEHSNVFARMFPEAKLKVIEALKHKGEIVAMTGDGVNDGPALKAAHIGIAMGLRGSEVARNTASLVIVDDDLEHMVEAVALGRRIYENLKKAIRYILSIHIPIILIVSIPFLFFDPNLELFTPVHVIFLELIMGPTCSIIFENEPIEANSMKQKPRNNTRSFFSFHELRMSIIQGLFITVSCFGMGIYFNSLNASDELVRTSIFATLIFSNLFLTLVNRSFELSVIKSFANKNRLIPFILSVSLLLLLVSIYVAPVQSIFEFEALSWQQFLLCLVAAFVGVFWIEGYKFFSRKANSNV
ncbi:MAG: haloacid dehalogenase [Bacteroidetes bacterium B1(2017)]|nr:MAG: haloacid dehalogenase [Bacteroidetes bacterium B1(2017)]